MKKKVKDNVMIYIFLFQNYKNKKGINKKNIQVDHIQIMLIIQYYQ